MIDKNDLARWLETGVVPTAAQVEMPDHFDVWFQSGQSPENLMGSYLERHQRRKEAIESYGFAIPCAEAMDALKSLSPILEVGAGTGYWSALLVKQGVDVIATDAADDNYPFAVGCHFDVQASDAVSSVKEHSNRNVLMVWPCYGEPWTAETAAAMKPGAYLALVSEGRGGCVANDDLFDILDESFETTSMIDLPVWYGMHDRLSIHRKS